MARRTALLIDDDPAIHTLVDHILDGIVDELVVCSTAKEGIARAKERRPNLILLDIGMPDMDGFQVLRLLRKQPETEQVPILFLTGRSDQDSVVEALEAGAIDYVTKPFEVPVFQARVRSALRTRTKSFAERRPIESVLLIDDDPDIHKLVEFFLEGVAQVHHAYRVEDGVRRAIEMRPTVILLDLELPGGNGFQVCRQLKALEQTAEIPIVILSGDPGVHRMAAGLDRGAVDYMVKPITKDLLRARVRAASRRDPTTTA